MLHKHSSQIVNSQELSTKTSLLIAKITDFGNSHIMLILYVYASMIVNIKIHNP